MKEGNDRRQVNERNGLLGGRDQAAEEAAQERPRAMTLL